MNQDQATPKPKRAAKQKTGGGWMRRLVLRALVWVDGSDYRERYLRLAANFALSDMMGRQGRFKSARGRWHDCLITGIVVRQYGGDYLIINYTTEDGHYIEGAEIPRDGFRPANADGDGRREPAPPRQ